MPTHNRILHWFSSNYEQDIDRNRDLWNRICQTEHQSGSSLPHKMQVLAHLCKNIKIVVRFLVEKEA
jgi:hypothetical protein